MAAGISQQTRKREKQAPQAAAQWATARQDMAAQLPNSAQIEMAHQAQENGSIYADALKAKFMEHQLPSAEREADRIAAGIHASTPQQVKEQLGEKMGADFSGVKFHTDASSAGQADTIGARAFTTGRDVYFGQGGFDAGVAAHELVHTVQQGSVAADMGTVSAPAGEVQMKPETGGVFSRIGSWLYNKTIGSIKRSHARAREDVIRNKGEFKKMGFWRKMQYAFTHPAALFAGTGKRGERNKARLDDKNRWDNEEARVEEYLKRHQLATNDWLQQPAQQPAGQQAAQQPAAQQQQTLSAEDKGRKRGEGGFYPTVKDIALDNLVEDEGTGALLFNQEADDDSEWYEKGLLGMNSNAKKAKSVYDIASGTLGTTSALSGIVKGGMDFKDSLKSGIRGSTTSSIMDMLESAADGSSSAFSAVKGAMRFVNPNGLKTLGRVPGTQSGFTKLISGGDTENLGTPTILSGISAGLKFIRGVGTVGNNAAIHWNTKKLNQKWDAEWEKGKKQDPNQMTQEQKDDQQRNKMLHQSSFLARKNAKANVIKGLTNIVDAAGDVGAMMNPIPLLGTGISAAKGLINMAGNGIAGSVKKNANIAMLNEEMNLDDKIEDYAKELTAKRELDKGRTALTTDEDKEKKWKSLSERKRDEIRRVAKHVILKAHGFSSGKRSEAVGRLIMNRSEYLTDHANDSTSKYKDDTSELINAMGVKRVDGEYDKDDVATQMGLEGGESGLTNIQRSRASTLKWYARKSGWKNFFKSIFLGSK